MEAIAIDRKAMLGGDSLAEWRRPNFTRAVALVLLDYVLIVLAAVLCETFWSLVLYVLVVMFIAARQLGLGTTVLHDGVHGLLSRNRRLNDLFGKTLCLTLLIPLIVGFNAFRSLHLAHHRFTNNDNDPDLPQVNEVYLYSSRLKVIAMLLLRLSGLVFLFLVFQMVRFGSWRARIVTLTMIAVCLAGLLLSIRPVELFLLYWIVPFATWGQFANTVRAISEHYPAATFAREHVPAQALTRDILPTWFDSLFMTTRGINYHLTHHLFPSVPFYRLKALQRRISGTDAYQGIAHVTLGYHRALAELLRRRPP